MGGDRQCVIEDGHTISYAQLDDLVERLLERVARIHGEREVSFVEERHAKPRILAPIADAEEVGTRDLSALRILAFAEKPFLIECFNRFRAQLSHPRYFDMYGSTETNMPCGGGHALARRRESCSRVEH